MAETMKVGSERRSFPLAIVTGSAHRIGRELALHLARQGYAIGLHFHSSADKATQTGNEIARLGLPVFLLKADLREEAQILSMFSQVDSILNEPKFRISNLKMFVNSAAVMQRTDARSMKIQEFDDVISLNLRAPFLCSQLAFARMLEPGLIVNISDIAAQKSWTGYPAYSVSKAGLDSLTRILARSFAPGVRVNAIAPGLALAPSQFPADEWTRLVDRLPLKRSATINEISSALDFLIKNEYITGQTITIDGGYSLL